MNPSAVTRHRRFSIGVGEPLPLGMTKTCEGFNFAVFSRHARSISLLLFDGMDDEALVSLPLDPVHNRTGDIWHEGPLNSINLVTCHDGFTLNDLVSYARKHNENNGEGNCDGIGENYSENNGVEGSTDDAGIEHIRLRQIKNFLVTLFVSRGVPMLLGGDEFRRTQGGNNNAYCQDNEVSWYDWRLAEKNVDLVRFVSRLIAFRTSHPVLSLERFYNEAEIQWFGAEGEAPDWHGRDNRIGCLIREEAGDGPRALSLLFNAALQPCRFVLPAPPAGRWRVAVDTGQPAPNDIPEDVNQSTVDGDVIVIGRASMVLTSSSPVRERPPPT